MIHIVRFFVCLSKRKTSEVRIANTDTDNHNVPSQRLFRDSCIPCYREARDQKFSRNDGDTANQLRKAIAVADINLVQWFKLHLSRSFPMRTVIPADAQAAANVRVEVTCNRTRHLITGSRK